MSAQWLHARITDRKNFGTNRKRKVVFRSSEPVKEGTVFLDCHQTQFKVGVTANGWTLLKPYHATPVFPGEGPYQLVDGL